MSRNKRIAASSLVLALLVAGAFASPAPATLKGNCIIGGQMKTQDKQDPDIGIRIQGGAGKFGFADVDALCKGDLNKDGIPETETIGITASGWYASQICGTMKMLGEIQTITGRPKWQLMVGQKFAIDVKKFIGTWKWHDWDKPDLDVKVGDDPEPVDGKDNPAGEKNYTTAGSVTLTASTVKPGVPDFLRGECVKGLEANGSFTFHFDA